MSGTIGEVHRYWYSYTTICDYSSPITDHAFLIRAIPAASASQAVEDSALTVAPQCATLPWLTANDGSGLYGFIGREHRAWVFSSQGIVCRRCIPEPVTPGEPVALMLHPTPLTRVHGDSMSHAAAQLAARCASATPLECATAAMHLAHTALAYAPGTTDCHTTAAEAWSHGHGVCQDFAHIMIALLRRCGVAARYAAGLVTGEGATHAWVEALTDEGWVGFDPTADAPITAGHIKITHGRDARDCDTVRGTYRGNATERTSVTALVKPLD